jgi:cytochrome b pre-mRNA-processing protein 3
MFSFFKKRNKEFERQVIGLYEKIVRQSRQPVFYKEYNVPDTVDGRFEMISVHVILVLLRLRRNADDETREVSQRLFDEMFHDMDRNLREMGVGDLSVPKKMKVMMHGFNGRMQAYSKILSGWAEDGESMQDAVARNVYGTSYEIGVDNIAMMADYITNQYEHVRTLSLLQLLNDDEIFLPVSPNGDGNSDEEGV